jgi:Nuclear RNA-splicing-associated protein
LGRAKVGKLRRLRRPHGRIPRLGLVVEFLDRRCSLSASRQLRVTNITIFFDLEPRGASTTRVGQVPWMDGSSSSRTTTAHDSSSDRKSSEADDRGNRNRHPAKKRKRRRSRSASPERHSRPSRLDSHRPKEDRRRKAHSRKNKKQTEHRSNRRSDAQSCDDDDSRSCSEASSSTSSSSRDDRRRPEKKKRRSDKRKAPTKRHEGRKHKRKDKEKIGGRRSDRDREERGRPRDADTTTPVDMAAPSQAPQSPSMTLVSEAGRHGVTSSGVASKELDDAVRQSHDGRRSGASAAAAAVVPAGASRGPMTREQYEAERAVVRQVYDAETGRVRLVRGTGEVIEQIVSRHDHLRINRTATRGDGASYATQVLHAAAAASSRVVDATSQRR